MKYMPERTSRNLQDHKFPPSWMDSSSMVMIPMANRHPGFYTPNSGSMGAIFHNQAGDLHTPTGGLHTMTPLSFAKPLEGPQQCHSGMSQCSPQFLQSQMPEINPYMQGSYAPSAFVQRDPGYDVMDETGDESVNGSSLDQASNISSVTASADFSSVPATHPISVSYAGEK